MNQFLIKVRDQSFLWLSLLLTIVMATITSGCSEEKARERKEAAPIGACDVLEKKPDDIKKPLEVNYGDKAKLLGLTAEKLSQNQLRVVYFWQPLDEIEPYHQVFVHFSDMEGNNLFGNDHPFCEQKPFVELKGKFVKESFMINIPGSAVGKIVYIKIGVYAPELKSGQRLQITSRGAAPTDDANTRAIVEKINL